MQRPVKAKDGSFECPANYKACNPEFFGKSNGQDFVICYKDGEKSSTCPITDLKLKASAKEAGATYKEVKGQQQGAGKSIFISYDYMQLGIEAMTLAPNEPCLDSGRYNAATN